MQHTDLTPDVSVVIGRWQILHLGHGSLWRTALALAPKTLIVIGSAWHSRDPHNPFTVAERQQMFEAVLTPEERGRVTFLPVRDYYDDERWAGAVRAAVASHTSRADRVVLVGHKKDHTSSYLDAFPGWQLHEVASAQAISATDLRRVYFETSDLPTALTLIGNYVEPGVRRYLEGFSRLPAFRALIAEHQAILASRAEFPDAWYLTADCILRSTGRVLLTRRSGVIGRGLWALPGGFVEPGERIFHAAVRELGEETGYRPLLSTLKRVLKGQAVFDHPQRSPRGRLVTTAFYFDLGEGPDPEIHLTAETLEYGWFTPAQIAAMESDLFEDHACILDHFLPIFSPKPRVSGHGV